MAATAGTNNFKKYHFWYLLIPFAFCALALFGALVFDVSASTDERIEAIKKHGSDMAAVKGEAASQKADLEEQAKTLKARREQMWEANWKEQKALFTWPKSILQLGRGVENLKFGADIVDQDVRRGFNKARYDAEYTALAKQVEPLQFDGGAQSVLRHIDIGAVAATSEDIWLALETFWVQREMVLAAHRVNQDAAKFTLDAARSSSPTRRVFTSKIWEFEVALEKRDQDSVLKGKLTNRTNRLQPLGIGNRMYLRIWLSDAETLQGEENSFLFAVEGESVKAETTVEVKQLPEHVVRDPGADMIFRVEQVFDSRTLPVKQVNRLELTYPSSRTAALPLRMAKFSEPAAPAGGTPTAPTTPTVPTPTMPGGPPAPTGGDPSAESATTPYGQERRRYIDVTDQVRRMPLAMTVVLEQAYATDLLVALANSPLRFQETQAHWSRYYGTIRDLTPIRDLPDAKLDPKAPKGGKGGKGGPDDEERPFTPKGGTQPSFPGGFPSFGAPTAGGEPPTGNLSLIEFSVYGIVTLYEKFDVPPAAKTPATGAPLPTGAAPPTPPKL